MSYMYLIVAVLLNTTSSIFGKVYNRKNENLKSADIVYNLVFMICACVFWAILYLTHLDFDPGVLKYSFAFALSYIVCNVALIKALKHGSAALTSLFMGLSLIITSVWGLIFWGQKATAAVIIGLIMVVVSITLCLNPQKSQKFSIKWVVFALLAMAGNAGCAIVQRTQMVKFDGEYSNMMMFFATFISAFTYSLITVITSFANRKHNYEKTEMTSVKTTHKEKKVRMLWIPSVAAACNVLLNLFVMLLALTELSPSLIYPVLSAGGISLVTVYSLIVFKERMKLVQWIGIVVGIAAVVMLSL